MQFYIKYNDDNRTAMWVHYSFVFKHPLFRAYCVNNKLNDLLDQHGEVRELNETTRKKLRKEFKNNADRKLRVQQKEFEDTLESSIFQQSFMEPEYDNYPITSSRNSNTNTKLKYKHKRAQSHHHDRKDVKTARKMPVNHCKVNYSFKDGDYDRQFKPRIRK